MGVHLEPTAPASASVPIAAIATVSVTSLATGPAPSCRAERERIRETRWPTGDSLHCRPARPVLTTAVDASGLGRATRWVGETPQHHPGRSAFARP